MKAHLFERFLSFCCVVSQWKIWIFHQSMNILTFFTSVFYRWLYNYTLSQSNTPYPRDRTKNNNNNKIIFSSIFALAQILSSQYIKCMEMTNSQINQIICIRNIIVIVGSSLLSHFSTSIKFSVDFSGFQAF